jgi:hypothetical protein
MDAALRDLRVVSGDGNCFFASAMVCLLLPTLKCDDREVFEKWYAKIVFTYDPTQHQREALTAAKALHEYWLSNFNDNRLEGDFQTQWLNMAMAFRLRIGSVMENIQSFEGVGAKDFLSHLEAAGCFEKSLLKACAYIPLEWSYGLSNFVNRPVHMFSWDDDGLKCAEYNGTQSGCYWPPKMVEGSNEATQIILYFHKFESKDVPEHSGEVDHRAHKANHFDSIHPQDLGPCPQNIPWIEDWQKEMNEDPLNPPAPTETPIPDHVQGAWTEDLLAWRKSDAYVHATMCGVCKIVRDSSTGFGHACGTCGSNVCKNFAWTCCKLTRDEDTEGSVTCHLCFAIATASTFTTPNAKRTEKNTKSRKRKAEGAGEPDSITSAVVTRREFKETNAKWRATEQLCKRQGYLAPPGTLANTSWWKDVAKHSTMLPNWDPTDRKDFACFSTLGPASSGVAWLKHEVHWIAVQTGVASEIWTLAKTQGKIRNWAHDPILKQRLQKVTVHIPGKTRAHPTMWGELEEITDAEKTNRRASVLELRTDTKIGAILLSAMDTCVAKIPPEMAELVDGWDKTEKKWLTLPYDITVNYSTGPMPHHVDEDKYDGPGGCILVASVNLPTMTVFGEYSALEKEDGPDIRHKWHREGTCLAFCGDMRILYDHGTYPGPVNFDGNIPDVLEAGMSTKAGVRASYVFRLGDTTPAQSTTLAEALSRVNVVPEKGEGGASKAGTVKVNFKPAASKKVYEYVHEATGGNGDKHIEVPPTIVIVLPKFLDAAVADSACPPQRMATTTCGEVYLVEYETISYEKGRLLLRKGSTFTVMSTESQPTEVCVLGLYAMLGVPDGNFADVTGVFVLCVARTVDEKGKKLRGSPETPETEAVYAATQWGPPLLSHVARFYNNKCSGCPRSVGDPRSYSKALGTITLSMLSSSNMQIRNRGTNGSAKTFRESRLSEFFWERIVPYEGRVVQAPSQMNLSNMDPKILPWKSKDMDPKILPQPPSGLIPARRIRTPRQPDPKDPKQGQGPPTLVVANLSPDPLRPVPHVTPGSGVAWPSGGLENFQPIISAMVNASAMAFDRPHSRMQDSLVLQQGRQVDRAQSQMYNVAMQLAHSLSCSNSNLREPAPAAPAAPAPAAPDGPEEELGAWLKANKIKHDAMVVDNLVALGVCEGVQILMLDQDDWAKCGFLKLPITLLQALKAKQPTL